MVVQTTLIWFMFVQTCIGEILVSINPIHPVPNIYSDHLLASAEDLPYPHIYVSTTYFSYY